MFSEWHWNPSRYSPSRSWVMGDKLSFLPEVLLLLTLLSKFHICAKTHRTDVEQILVITFQFLNGLPRSSISDHILPKGISFFSSNFLSPVFSSCLTHIPGFNLTLTTPHTGITFPSLSHLCPMPTARGILDTSFSRRSFGPTGFGITELWFWFHPGHLLTAWFYVNFLLWKIQTYRKAEATTVCKMNFHEPLSPH